MIDEAFQTMEQAGSTDQYVIDCSDKMQHKLQPVRVLPFSPPVRVLPPSPEDPQDAARIAPLPSDGSWMMPHAPCGAGSDLRCRLASLILVVDAAFARRSLHLQPRVRAAAQKTVLLPMRLRTRQQLPVAVQTIISP